MNRVQTLRSSVAGNRPATGTRAVGELYANFPDLQLGVINPAQQAQDLLAVRNFSATASYVAGDIVVQGGQIWTATGPVAPGAFNPANWQSVSAASVTVNDVAPANAHQGDLWYDSLGGQMYCWYDDGSSAQWVIVVNNAPDLSNYATLPALAAYAPLAGATFTGPLTGTNATFSGPVTPSGGIVGTTTPTTPALAGQVGEIISSLVTANVALPINTSVNIASIVLTPGSWEIFGEVAISPTGAGSNAMFAALNFSPAGYPAVPGLNVSRAACGGVVNTNTAGSTFPLHCRGDYAATQTYYLSAQCNGVAANGVGWIQARRTR